MAAHTTSNASTSHALLASLSICPVSCRFLTSVSASTKAEKRAIMSYSWVPVSGLSVSIECFSADAEPGPTNFVFHKTIVFAIPPLNGQCILRRRRNQDSSGYSTGHARSSVSPRSIQRQ